MIFMISIASYVEKITVMEPMMKPIEKIADFIVKKSLKKKIKKIEKIEKENGYMFCEYKIVYWDNENGEEVEETGLLYADGYYNAMEAIVATFGDEPIEVSLKAHIDCDGLFPLTGAHAEELYYKSSKNDSDEK